MCIRDRTKYMERSDKQQKKKNQFIDIKIFNVPFDLRENQEKIANKRNDQIIFESNEIANLETI